MVRPDGVADGGDARIRHRTATHASSRTGSRARRLAGRRGRRSLVSLGAPAGCRSGKPGLSRVESFHRRGARGRGFLYHPRLGRPRHLRPAPHARLARLRPVPKPQPHRRPARDGRDLRLRLHSLCGGAEKVARGGPRRPRARAGARGLADHGIPRRARRLWPRGDRLVHARLARLSPPPWSSARWPWPLARRCSRASSRSRPARCQTRCA